MRRSAFIAGAVALFAGVRSGGGGEAPAATAPGRETTILNWFLLFEFVQQALYERAATTPSIRGELRRFATDAAAHEADHVDRLTRVLGAAARSRPSMRLGDAVRGEGRFTAAALSLEETATAIFIGQAANLSRDGIRTVAPIVSVDGRHAAWIRAIAGRLPVPRAADSPKTPREALAVLDRIGIVR